MPLTVFALILVSVSLSALAQLSLKAGMASAAVQASKNLAPGLASSISMVLTALTQPWVLGGLALYGLGTVVWLLVLARLDVSLAYPFVALGFVLVMLLGAWFFGEPITPAKLAGTACVGLGVWLLARG